MPPYEPPLMPECGVFVEGDTNEKPAFSFTGYDIPAVGEFLQPVGTAYSVCLKLYGVALFQVLRVTHVVSSTAVFSKGERPSVRLLVRPHSDG
jgi:hypothetical protein